MNETSIPFNNKHNIIMQSLNRIKYLQQKNQTINKNIIHLHHSVPQQQQRDMNNKQLPTRTPRFQHPIKKITNEKYTLTHSNSGKESIIQHNNTLIQFVKRQNYLQVKQHQLQLREQIKKAKDNNKLQKMLSRYRVSKGKKKGKMHIQQLQQQKLYRIQTHKQQYVKIKAKRNYQKLANLINIKTQQQQQLNTLQDNLAKQTGFKNIIQQRIRNNNNQTKTI